jgi:DnaJ like chaperone protein
VSIWGKLIGGTVGFFALGGPLGALLGVAAGHLYDQTRKAQTAQLGGEGAGPRLGRDALQVAFTVAVIALAAKLAKADGQVTRDEVATLKRIFHIPEIAGSQIGQIFNEAKKSTDGFEPYAKQIATLLRNNRPVLEDLLGALLMIAHADGVYHPAERAYIAQVGYIFGFSAADIRRIESTFIAGGSSSATDPYEVLGITGKASDAEVKSAYRKLLQENHPDKVMAQGLPEEFIEVANKKMAEINAAYDRVKAERNLS